MRVYLFAVVQARAQHIFLSKIIGNEQGESLGFIAEEDRGFFGTVTRQMFSTHRPFRAVVLDTSGLPVLWVGLVTFLKLSTFLLFCSCDDPLLG